MVSRLAECLGFPTLGVNYVFALKCSDEEIGAKDEKKLSDINEHRQPNQINVLSFCQGLGINNAEHTHALDRLRYT